MVPLLEVDQLAPEDIESLRRALELLGQMGHNVGVPKAVSAKIRGDSPDQPKPKTKDDLLKSLNAARGHLGRAAKAAKTANEEYDKLLAKLEEAKVAKEAADAQHQLAAAALDAAEKAFKEEPAKNPSEKNQDQKDKTKDTTSDDEAMESEEEGEDDDEEKKTRLEAKKAY